MKTILILMAIAIMSGASIATATILSVPPKGPVEDVLDIASATVTGSVSEATGLVLPRGPICRDYGAAHGTFTVNDIVIVDGIRRGCV